MGNVKQKWPTLSYVAGALFWRTGEIDGGPVWCALYIWPTRTNDEKTAQWAIELGAPGTEYVGSYAACSHLERGYTYNKCRSVAKELLTMAKQKIVWGEQQRAVPAESQGEDQ